MCQLSSRHHSRITAGNERDHSPALWERQFEWKVEVETEAAAGLPREEGVGLSLWFRYGEIVRKAIFCDLAMTVFSEAFSK